MKCTLEPNEMYHKGNLNKNGFFYILPNLIKMKKF